MGVGIWGLDLEAWRSICWDPKVPKASGCWFGFLVYGFVVVGLQKFGAPLDPESLNPKPQPLPRLVGSSLACHEQLIVSVSAAYDSQNRRPCTV